MESTCWLFLIPYGTITRHTTRKISDMAKELCPAGTRTTAYVTAVKTPAAAVLV